MSSRSASTTCGTVAARSPEREPRRLLRAREARGDAQVDRDGGELPPEGARLVGAERREAGVERGIAVDDAADVQQRLPVAGEQQQLHPLRRWRG